MPKSTGEFNGIRMGCLWVMVMFIAKVTMWLVVLLMYDIFRHMDKCSHCE